MGSTPHALSCHSHTAIGSATDPLGCAGPASSVQVAHDVLGNLTTSLNTSFGPPSFPGNPLGCRKETSQYSPIRTQRSASDSRKVPGRQDSLDDSVEQVAPKVRLRRSSPSCDPPGSDTMLVSALRTDTLHHAVVRSSGAAQGKASQAYGPYTGVFPCRSRWIPRRHTASGHSGHFRESTSRYIIDEYFSRHA